MNGYLKFILSVMVIASIAFLPCKSFAWQEGAPDKPYEGWPKVVGEVDWPRKTKSSDASGASFEYKNFKIFLSLAADQSGSGTGGPIIDIHVKDTLTDKELIINDQSIAVGVLEEYGGYPQIEMWGRGGGGSYSRVLYRVENGQYRAIRDDLFSEQIADAKRKDITATFPNGKGLMYYTETMYPSPSM